MLQIQKKLTLVNRTITSNRKKQWIVIHYVGAVSTAKNNADYFYDKDRNASAHYFVDDNEIWQCVDDSNIAWHCGANKYYHDSCRNKNSIGIELCCKKDEKGNLYMTDKTIKNTQELVLYLMEKYGIKAENVIRHYDVTHKICPAPFVNDITKWEKFKKGLVRVKEITDIKEALDYLEEKGRLTNRQYWEKAIQVVRNQEFLFIKWANDVKTLIEVGE